MTLRARVAMIRGSFWPVAVGLMSAISAVGLAVGARPGVVLVDSFVAALVVMIGWRPAVRRVLARLGRRQQARMEAALAEGDDEAYRRLLDEMDEYYRVCVARSERQRTRLRCSGLTAEERWSEALALVGTIDRAEVPAAERVHHDNLVAWIGAHAGETARAVELARANLEAASDARTRPYLHGTLGTALLLDGQPAAALEPLRESLALGGPRWATAVRRYYLGEALAALGRFDEARAEWHEVVTIAPKSRWGRGAKERLDAGAPSAYR